MRSSIIYGLLLIAYCFKLRPRTFYLSFIIYHLSLLTSCSNYFKNDYKDNSPTSGQLKVYYDEGLYRHAKNQIFTFESQYGEVNITEICASEGEAIQALYNDSCEAIMISRTLNANEKKAFESKKYFPKFSAVAISGIELITNTETPINHLTQEEILKLLTQTQSLKDSSGKEIKLKVLLDKNNSSVVHYLLDSVLKGKTFSSDCNVIGSTIETINHVAKNKNTIAFIDFAWLSDVDDSIAKANKDFIKVIPISKLASSEYVLPSQSSFKTKEYPFTRTIYVMRKTGDFTLAKGFESFVAGPKGQLTFLKQGLLPARQAERLVEVKMEPLNVK